MVLALASRAIGPFIGMILLPAVGFTWIIYLACPIIHRCCHRLFTIPCTKFSAILYGSSLHDILVYEKFH